MGGRVGPLQRSKQLSNGKARVVGVEGWGGSHYVLGPFCIFDIFKVQQLGWNLKKKIPLFSWAGKYFSEKVQYQVKVPIRKNWLTVVAQRHADIISE